MRIRNVGRHQEEVKLMMTPMIDIVFLLLVFFIMTFKINPLEGDFNIRMPVAAPNQTKLDDLPLSLPMKISLKSMPDGRLAGVYLAEARMPDDAPFKALRERIIQIVSTDAGPGPNAEDREIELNCDYDLCFEYTMDAITAVSGKVQQGQIVKLIDKIKFAPSDQAPQP